MVTRNAGAPLRRHRKIVPVSNWRSLTLPLLEGRPMHSKRSKTLANYEQLQERSHRRVVDHTGASDFDVAKPPERTRPPGRVQRL